MGRGREWLIAILAGVAIVGVGYGQVTGWRANAKVQAADSARFALQVQLEEAAEREVGLQASLDSVVVQFESFMDSITALPAPTPRLSVRYETVLDTAAMSEAVADAVQELRFINSVLEDENENLRYRIATIEERTAQAIAEIRANADARVANAEAALADCQEALRLATEAVQASQQGTPFLTKLAWAAVGFGIAEGIDYIRGDDNGNVVVVNDSPKHKNY